MKKIVFLIFFLFITAWCTGQTNLSFRQFYFSPFNFNPAYTGIDGYSDIYFVSRKQWINFKDAPTVSGFSFQYPTRGRSSLGFSVSNQQVVSLQNTLVSV